MKKRKKLFVVSWIFIAVALLSLCIYRLTGGFPPSRSKIEKVFDNNYDAIEKISDFLSKYDGDYDIWCYYEPNYLRICYNNSDEIGGVESETKFIDIDEVQTAFNKIGYNGFSYVYKKNNYVQFVKWQSLDSSVSIIYCEDKEPAIIDSGVRYLSKLSKENWYYYKNVSD
jgi:hypothetical protein